MPNPTAQSLNSCYESMLKLEQGKSLRVDVAQSPHHNAWTVHYATESNKIIKAYIKDMGFIDVMRFVDLRGWPSRPEAIANLFQRMCEAHGVEWEAPEHFYIKYEAYNVDTKQYRYGVIDSSNDWVMKSYSWHACVVYVLHRLAGYNDRQAMALCTTKHPGDRRRLLKLFRGNRGV